MNDRHRFRETATLENRRPSLDSRLGIAAGLAAYGLWGVMPLYFASLKAVPPPEILAQRVVWCGLFLAGVLTVTGRWPVFVRACRSATTLRTFLATALLLSVNWLVYIHGVTSGQTLETSLGYFINPLLNVGLGFVVFRERLRPLQLGALALAVVGVTNLVVAAGHFPWIALTLATSFAFYGLLRKTAPADAVVGVSIETFILLPGALAYGCYLWAAGGLHIGAVDRATDGLLVASGVITAVPLLFFGVAARNLRLSTLGFLQYLAPSAQFLLAITVLGEPMAPEKWASFACIWTALVVYSFDAWRGLRRTRRIEAERRVQRPVPAVSRTG
jgi:chloramphenicol-sensitive protein RarD